MTEYGLVFFSLLVVAFGFYLGYDRFFQRRRKPESRLYLQALRELLDGRQESAFAKLRQVVAEDSGNLDAYLRLGQILRENKQPARALQVHKDLTLRKDLASNDKAAVLRQLVEDFIALDDMKMAESAVKELIALDAKDYQAHVRLLHLQETAQNWEAAYATAVELLRLEANKSKKPLARFKFQSAEQLFKRREYHKARVLYKEAIGLDPQFVSAYLAIGDSYRREERHEDAVTFWGKLITAVPEKGHLVIDRLKKTLFDLGRFGDIQNICQSILEDAPKNLEARRALAEFYKKKGDLDLAVELWEKIIDDYPDDIGSILELIRVSLGRDDSEQIRQLLKRLEKRQRELKNQNPDNSTTSAPATAQA